MATDWGYASESLFFSYIRAAKIPYLPFAFSIMLFINYKFASKFKESERLAIELSDINKSLDHIVEERTNELKRQQAFRHNMMLNIFHDLRSPLFVLKGCTEIIPAETDDVKENLSIMKERIDFITHMTDDLFLIEQLEDDKVIFASEQIDLNQLLQTIGSATKIEAAKKGISFHIQMEHSCIVWGDRYRLGQALQNLITNAIYYTPQNGKVSVKMQKIHNMAHIYVTDSGKGIGKDEIEKVFLRYYHNHDTDPHQSTGLGLSIAQEIIKRHHGIVTVQSTLGTGSTFEVILPLLTENKFALFNSLDHIA
jgi:signal transduction histidine kinase